MTELWLKFTDDYGAEQRIRVEADNFTVGRHSDNDLSVANEKLSRRHVKIERFADVFVVSDCASSNGTTLNGAKLTEPVSLKNGDLLNLGGGLIIEVEMISGAADASNYAANAVGNSSEGESSFAASSAATGAPSVSASSFGDSIPTSFFYIAPAFALVVLILVGGLFFAFSGKKEVAKRDNDIIYSKDTPDDDLPKNKKEKDSDKTPKPSPSGLSDNPANNQISDPIGSQTPVVISGDIEKVKQNSSAFMRRIAQNDANPFLTQEQANIVNERIKAIKNSSNLVENIKSVKKDSAQFETLAASKNLKPQFLAAAALTALGSESGNPTEKAKEMLPVLSELKVKLDNKLADDNLLIIAAFDEGKAGRYGSLSGKIEGLAKKLTNVSPRQIRSIWFLKEKAKITDAEFEFALRFLAIGTIMQNPPDFGVKTEAAAF